VPVARAAIAVVAIGTVATTAQADPPRPVVLEDLSPTRAYGADLTLGGWNQEYTGAAIAQLDVWIDAAIRAWLKLDADVPIGGGHWDRDEIDPEKVNGVYLGNARVGARIVGTLLRHGGGVVDAGVGVAVLLPTPMNGRDSVARAAVPLYFPHRPGPLENELTVVPLQASVRYARGPHFGQLGVMVVDELNGGPRVDVVRVGLAIGGRFVRGYSAVAELCVTDYLPSSERFESIDVAIGRGIGQATVFLHGYVPFGAYYGATIGALGVAVEVPFW
jgi:hypothetical protein